MQQPPVPVAKNDPDDQVLERILSTLADYGPMPIDQIVSQLHLYEHPSAEKILSMAIGDGMIETTRGRDAIQINEFGLVVAKDIRDSMEAAKIGSKL